MHGSYSIHAGGSLSTPCTFALLYMILLYNLNRLLARADENILNTSHFTQVSPAVIDLR